MSETINKLQPDRTIHLRGFSGFGAAAALHHASPGGFEVTGVFRDQADFAVAILWDADDFFEHYSMKYLPDFDFSGMVLTFDVAYQGLQPIDSPKYNWIDWATLDCISTSGTPQQARLFDNAMLVGGTFTPSSGTFHLQTGANGVQPWDRLTLWLQNIAFDYMAPASGEPQIAAVAANLAAQINQYDWAGAGLVNSLMASPGTDASLTITAARAGMVSVSGATVTWVSGTKFPGVQAGDTMWLGSPGTMAAYTVASVDSPTQVTLTAVAPAQTGANYLAPRGGYDGNMITVPALSKTATLTTAEPSITLAGGSSDATWRVSIDFTALGIDQLRQAWLTFAPALSYGQAYADTEWSAAFSNWNVEDPGGHRVLKVAGPGSVRVGNADSAAKYTGASWALQAGFFWRGFCQVANAAGDSVTLKYMAQQTHDLYVGTSLYTDRGTVLVSLDGDPATALDCYLDVEPAVQTRRVVRTGVAAGSHTVTITLAEKNTASSNMYFYFDFLEAAVPSDVQPFATTHANVAAAIDYDTNHGYQLSPQRLLWNLYALGFRGSIDEYLGVFWWNQRKRALAAGQEAFHSWTVAFGGTWADQDAVYVAIGDPNSGTMGKTVFPADNSLTIAKHFAAFVNETFVGVWASAAGTAASATLTITARTPAWSFAFSATATSAGGTLTTRGDLNAGDQGQWVIDDSVTPVINRASTDWHADLFAQAAWLGLPMVSAVSMELVNPPAGYAQCFQDGTPVLTDTGFQSLNSTQCTFAPVVQAYQAEACKELAAAQAAAGLQPWIQFGEFLWWFFDWYPAADGSQHHAGMAFYDAYTAEQAAASLGRPLAYFDTINSDPSMNNYADANWLRERIKSHIDGLRAPVLAATPGTKFELLYPYDVNYPVTNSFGIGGALNHYVNFPAEFAAPATSGLDRIKMEALSSGSQERNFDKIKAAIMFPLLPPNSWARDSVAWLVAWFNGGCPWQREYLLASGIVSIVNFWAFDHLALLSWPLPLPTGTARAWRR